VNYDELNAKWGAMTPPDRDRWVAEAVMGIKVLGTAACSCYDGEWMVEADVDVSTAAAEPDGRLFIDGNEVRPVYQDQEDAWGDDYTSAIGLPPYAKVAGVSELALAPVPWYSTDIGDAWAVREWLLKRCDHVGIEEGGDGYPGDVDPRRCWANVCVDEKKGVDVQADGPNACEAICKAALMVALGVYS
jgi:hypothetical protein